MNNFGGFWTGNKKQIFMDYIHEYLNIMNKYPYFKLVYFDGFAGSGYIKLTSGENIMGIALSVITLDHPKKFDYYYLVEKNKKIHKELQTNIEPYKTNRKIVCIQEEANNKLIAMCKYLKQDKSRKALVLLDPFGMQMDWNTLEQCRGLGIDMWILVPTSIGMGRILPNNPARMKDFWIPKLEKFTGMTYQEIFDQVYKLSPQLSLIGSPELQRDFPDSQIAKFYQEKLRTIWDYVSDPLEVKRDSNRKMYHFFFVSNNRTAAKIANHLVNKFSKLEKN